MDHSDYKNAGKFLSDLTMHAHKLLSEPGINLGSKVEIKITLENVGDMIHFAIDTSSPTDNALVERLHTIIQDNYQVG